MYGNCWCVLQHAPYDAMVLVTQGYYVDQQLKATDGKWKVNTVSIELIFIDYILFVLNSKFLTGLLNWMHKYC